MAAAPGFGRRAVGSGPTEPAPINTFRRLGIARRISEGDGGRRQLRPAIGLSAAGFPSSVRWRILPIGWLGSCAGVKRWRSPDVRNSDLPVRREDDDRAELAAPPSSWVVPQ